MELGFVDGNADRAEDPALDRRHPPVGERRSEASTCEPETPCAIREGLERPAWTSGNYRI